MKRGECELFDFYNFCIAKKQEFQATTSLAANFVTGVMPKK